MATLFGRPHLFEGESHTVLTMDINALKDRGPGFTWDAFLQELRAELRENATNTEPNIRSITYSTKTSTNKFGNQFNAKMLTLIHEYEAAKSHAQKLATEHEEIESQRPPEIVPEVQYDEDGEIIEPKPKKKKEIKAEKEARKADLDRYQKLLDAQHRVSCLESKLPNVASLYAIRVEH